MSFVDAVEFLFDSFGNNSISRKHIADTINSKVKSKKAKNRKWHGFTLAKV